MDLSTTYLGFRLPHPVVPGASPLADDLDSARRLEDAGAPMIILRSIFEEQIVREELANLYSVEAHRDSHGESLTYLPEHLLFRFGPGNYLDHLRRLKKAVKVPVVASMNGTTPGGWTQYAKDIEDAGADALELNLYVVQTDPERAGAEIERELLYLVGSVRASVKIPLAVKLSPFFTSLPHFARRLEATGIDALVLFNRFYEPDIDVKEQQVARLLHLSDSSELLPRLHALAIVSTAVKCPLAATGGVHTGDDALKAVMSGASVVQVVSELLANGPGRIGQIRDRMAELMKEHEYASLAQVRGSMGLSRCPNPKAYERLNYMHLLQNWRV